MKIQGVKGRRDKVVNDKGKMKTILGGGEGR